MKAQEKIKARHLFLYEGKSLAEAAAAVGVCKSSTERWSVEEQWVEQRELIRYELRDKYLRENFKTYSANLLSVSDLAFQLMADGLAERHLVSRGKLTTRRMKVSHRTLMTAARTYVDLQSVINDLESYRRALKLG